MILLRQWTIAVPVLVEGSMRQSCRAIGSVLFVWIFLAGCGGNSGLETGAPAVGCNGAIISGTLRDSLTFQPVAQGIAILELGTELGTTPIYNFLPTQKVNTDAQGGFSLCAQSVGYPSVVMLEAMDAGGKAYPPYATLVTGATDLGIVNIGGCTLTCGFDRQQQTALPATIAGTITSAPIVVAGTLFPRFAMQALDGSKSPGGVPNLWNLAMPVLNPSMTATFSTVAGSCDGISPYCASYVLVVPAQSLVHPVSGGTLQAAASPVYSIDAELGTSVCVPIFASSVFQSDGKSFLTATPGAQLTAQNIGLTSCR
jgi:hypothetical protein